MVDDQKMMLELTRPVLSRLGFENIDDASDGYQALRLLREKKHKLVLSDLHMAAMGGIQLLKAVRADDELKNTPFILMTGSVGVPNVIVARTRRHRLVLPPGVELQEGDARDSGASRPAAWANLTRQATCIRPVGGSPVLRDAFQMPNPTMTRPAEPSAFFNQSSIVSSCGLHSPHLSGKPRP